MKGWIGTLLRVNLSDRSFRSEPFDQAFAQKWIGGRGMALKILWDELKPGIDPLGPENKFIVALGPISGVPAPNTGKAVVAAKSPLTGGYGDGNLGTRVTAQLRKAGYDLLVVEGRAEAPTILVIEDDRVEFHPADSLWGKGTYAAEEALQQAYGKSAGILLIGQGGENLVRYAVVRSLQGRAGGRPGMGAVMGSKQLKAIVVKGSGEIPLSFNELYRATTRADLKKVHHLDRQSGWSRQGTAGVLAWCNEVAALPVRNFRKTSHPDAWRIDGERVDAARVATYGCPFCVFPCGIAVHDREGHESELDYENIGLLGSNLEIFELDQVASLNYLCDDYGLDTISAGGVLGFYADAIEHGAAEGTFRFGDAEDAKTLLGLIARRQGIGDLLADGVMRMGKAFGRGSEAYAMHVKGLEISAYNCKFIPGMALAYGTSPIGAHHKEAWVITYELKETPRDSYGIEKARKVIELQRIRGGLFEFIVSCRFPWVELGWDLNHYAGYFRMATGLDWSLDDLCRVGDRIYALMKAFWAREFPNWSRKMDYPPPSWFDPANADKEGVIAGKVLDVEQYDRLLSLYYNLRGWDERGIPTRRTFQDLELGDEMKALEPWVRLE